MSRILVVEQSPTMRYSLVKRLKNQGFEPDTLDDFHQAQAVLKSESHAFGTLVLGWPRNTNNAVDDLLVLLEEPDLHHLVVIVVSEEQDPARKSWVTRRPHSALLLWESIEEIPECITALNKLNASPTSVGSDIDRASIKVLMVDDSPTVRVTYNRLLTGHGYQVETAASVREGYQKALDTPFDLAIIDYFMPDQTGDDLCRLLRDDSRTSTVTTSILTGTYMDNVIQASLGAGAVECMFKNEAQALFLARVDAMSRSVLDRRVIERESKHLEGLLNSVGDGVYGVDNRGRITFMNPLARSLLGFTENDVVVGRDPHTLFHHSFSDGTPKPPNRCFLYQSYQTGERLSDWHTLFWTQAGNNFPVEGTVYPVQIENDRQGSVVAFRDVTARHLMEEELRWQANHDALTKLLNRHYFEEELQKEVQRVARSKNCSALLLIDLDQFKYINDTAGHAAGDELLIQVSHRLSNRLRSQDTLARLGGDEFALILRNLDRTQIQNAAESFRQMLANHSFCYGDMHYNINGSIGIAMIDADAESPGEVLAHADVAVHIAKEKGRNQPHLYSPENEHRRLMDRDLGWSNRLRTAIENDEFELVFQPVFPASLTLRNGDDPGPDTCWNRLHESAGPDQLQYEALLRLPGAHQELIPPGAFLNAAERFSLMPAIDRLVVEKVIALLAREPETPVRNIAINLSAQTMTDPELVDDITRLLIDYRVDPGRLSFEITETTAITNLDAAQQLITQLGSLGCTFALDDFGSGFSSFGQLKHLDVDYIKIDGLFIQGLVSDPMDRHVVLAITQIAHSLGKKTVAEFVETLDAMETAHKCGVDYIQGHCVGPARLWSDICGR